MTDVHAGKLTGFDLVISSNFSTKLLFNEKHFEVDLRQMYVRCLYLIRFVE
jgi:hypothetical protein